MTIPIGTKKAFSEGDIIFMDDKKGDSIISVGLKLLSSKINEVVKVYGSESGEMHFKRIK